jgi:hypothetical protein
VSSFQVNDGFPDTTLRNSGTPSGREPALPYGKNIPTKLGMIKEADDQTGHSPSLLFSFRIHANIRM